MSCLFCAVVRHPCLIPLFALLHPTGDILLVGIALLETFKVRDRFCRKSGIANGNGFIGHDKAIGIYPFNINVRSVINPYAVLIQSIG